MNEVKPTDLIAPDSSPEHGSASPEPPSARWRGGFWSLVVTQFQGAFNDNALKILGDISDCRFGIASAAA